MSEEYTQAELEKLHKLHAQAQNPPEEPPSKALPYREPKYLKKYVEIAATARDRSIIHDSNYAYFCVSPTTGDIKLNLIHEQKVSARKNVIYCYEVCNQKEKVIGYVVEFTGRPQVEAENLGVGIFYSPAAKISYDNCDILFGNTKFRLLGFEGLDFFTSIKWKIT